MPRLDAAVIGTGPAGLEAAINLKMREKTFMLFGPGELSGKLLSAPRIDNYLGFPGISGAELSEKFLAHLSAMEIEITDKHITMAYHMGDYVSLATSSEMFEATAVIIATGVFNGRLFKGEKEFLGRGVGYCATCDAALYRGKKVAIIGYNDESVLEADFVAGIASEVYFIPAEKIKTTPCDKVKVIGQKVVEILGDKKVTGLKLDGGTIETDGVFVLRESIAPASLVPGLELQDGFIKVDAMMRTNLSGIYAAGDCTGKPAQFMRAAGQGQTAALTAVSYIDEMKKLK